MYRTPEEIMEAAAWGVTLGEIGEPVKAEDGPPQGPQPPPPPPPPNPTPPEVPGGWRRRVP